MPDDVFVALRAPFVVVHAIQDPAHRAGARAQHAFQAKAVFAGLDLLRVPAAYSGDVIGKGQRAFQEVGLAPELHLVDGKKVPGKHQQWQRVRRKQALIADVMDGEHRARTAEDWIGLVAGAQQNGDQSRLPVMAVKDLRHAQDLGRL